MRNGGDGAGHGPVSRDERVRWSRSRPRFVLGAATFAVAFLLVAGRLVAFGFMPSDGFQSEAGAALSTSVHRPDIVDRNGLLLATDIRTASLFADPARIVGIDDTVEQLASVLPGLDTAALRRRLANGGRFVWVQRELTPAQQALVHELGLPGVGFLSEPHRVYPTGPTAAHVLGSVDVDNRGLSGIERHIDRVRVLAAADSRERQAPVRLSLDLAVQHALRAELTDALGRYRAKAAAGVVLDVHSGEVVALSSLPDYDPNRRDEALDPDRFNRITAGVFELGSVFKVFTAAAALDHGVVSLQDGYDARQPLRVASHTIDDFHAKRRWLSVPEIFIYSSNIGSAKMALDMGPVRHREFLGRLGLLDRVATEIGDGAAPLVPAAWRPLTAMTISFGHGISITPLHMASATATLVNGGYRVPPTFLRRSREESRLRADRVVSQRTSKTLRYLMRLNVTSGTARQADAAGYRLGGKTGTAEKIVDGRYSSDARLTSFVGVFPVDEPQYVVYVMLDEPQRVPESGNLATAGVNAAPLTRRLVERIAPMLGVVPELQPAAPFDEAIAASY